MAKNIDLFNPIDSSYYDKTGEVKIVDSEYLHTKQILADGCYGLSYYALGKQFLIKFDENSKHNPHENLLRIANEKKAFFPDEFSRRQYKLTKGLFTNPIDNVFCNPFSILFIIKNGTIQNVAIDFKKIRGKQQFWDINLFNYYQGLSYDKNRTDGWGYSVQEAIQPNYLFINALNNNNFNFIATSGLKGVKEKYASFIGKGINCGPNEVKVFQCQPTGKIVKKYQYNLLSDNYKSEKTGKFIRFAVNGEPLQIENYKHNVKHGWQIQLLSGNKVDPFKFNFDSLDIKTSNKSEINEVYEMKWGKRDGKSICFYGDGTTLSINEFINGEKHGYQIYFLPGNNINPKSFCIESDTKKYKNKIRRIEFYQSGKKIVNPFILAALDLPIELSKIDTNDVSDNIQLDDDIPF